MESPTPSTANILPSAFCSPCFLFLTVDTAFYFPPNLFFCLQSGETLIPPDLFPSASTSLLFLTIITLPLLINHQPLINATTTKIRIVIPTPKLSPLIRDQISRTSFVLSPKSRIMAHRSTTLRSGYCILSICTLSAPGPEKVT